MSLTPTGLEIVPFGTVNPLPLFNGNTERIDELFTHLRTQTLTAHAPIATPYPLYIKLPQAGTIKKLYARTDAGTVTLTSKLGATTITGGGGSVTSAGDTFTPTALNVAAAGDVLSFELSSVTGAAFLSITVEFELTLP